LPCFVCSALNLQRPTATVNGMTVNGITGDGFTMNFDVQVANPNKISLPLTTADYKLSVSGTELLNGKADPAGSLPAEGSLAVPVSVTVTFENLLLVASAIESGRGDIPFDLAGGLTFDSGTPVLGKLRVPLSYSGTLHLQDIVKDPKVLLGSSAAKKLAGMLIGQFFGK
jgi:hypothetical protein